MDVPGYRGINTQDISELLLGENEQSLALCGKVRMRKCIRKQVFITL